MNRKGRELETLLLTMFAAVPLYFTYAMSFVPVAVFHLAMAGIVVRVMLGRSPSLLPPRLMRWLAIAYVPFYFVDWRFLGGTAIAASTHLVLFIAVYQPMESTQRENQAQRMLTTALIFIASLATSTHITVVVFVVAFAFLTFRQLMYVSHLETVRSVEREYAESPSGRAAGFYLAGSVAIGILLFPLLPRLRNPFMSGRAGSFGGSSTLLSETINFASARNSPTDGTVVARVWIDGAARDAFVPIRLRAAVYDRYQRGEWRQTPWGMREVPSQDGFLTVGRPAGKTAQMVVQQRTSRNSVYLPVGTYALSGMPARLYEGPSRESYITYYDGLLNLTVRVATQTEPLRERRITSANYPITPEVLQLARSIVGNETRPVQQAQLVESYLVRNFRYVPNAGDLGRVMSVEQFLLRDRAGHCEYFAAGMVVLMTALDVPARIAGGFYGGRFNPLTGYYGLRREDAHAWTEVWDGGRWMTFDSTPAALRPGSEKSGAMGEYLAALGDSLTFAWDRYVLTYGLGDQISLAEDAITWVRDSVAALRARNLRPLLGNVLVVGLVVVLVLAFLKRRRRTLFDVLAAHLQRRGIDVGPAMTMEEALTRLPPDAARELAPLIALYEEERFSQHHDRGRVGRIRRRLAELRA
jgi:transglutaminase-like putative cysteine protease